MGGEELPICTQSYIIIDAVIHAVQHVTSFLLVSQCKGLRAKLLPLASSFRLSSAENKPSNSGLKRTRKDTGRQYLTILTRWEYVLEATVNNAYKRYPVTIAKIVILSPSQDPEGSCLYPWEGANPLGPEAFQHFLFSWGWGQLESWRLRSGHWKRCIM